MGFSSLASALIERKNERMIVFSEQFGDAGLERLESDDIDCVVSGSELADMDGLAFVEVDQVPSVGHTPVLATLLAHTLVAHSRHGPHRPSVSQP